jgi:hypothetical protein
MAETLATQHNEGEILSATVAPPPPELAPDGSPVPTLVFESHTATDGSGRIIETFRDEDGDLRTRTIDHEPVSYPAPPLPTVVEYDVTADATGHGATIDAYATHAADADATALHHDGADAAPHSSDDTTHAASSAAHEADHAAASTEEGS